MLLWSPSQVNLFDEIQVDDSSRGGFLDGESSQRVERRFLGSVTIPFATILKERKVGGQSSRISVPEMTCVARLGGGNFPAGHTTLQLRLRDEC